MTSNERIKILVIDDSETVLDATQLALEESGYQVVTLSSPATFHRVLTRERPDLVLVDVSMPVVEGQVLIEIARRYRLSSCPIVLYSAQPDDRLRLLVEKCGADGYVRKTNDGEALRAAVAGYLSQTAERKAPAIRRPRQPLWLATRDAELKAKVEGCALESGCDLTTYDNPEECVDALRAGLPIALLLDTEGQLERARAACHQIKGNRQWAAVPVVVTANTPAEILRCWRWGADDFLLTPPRPGHLESKLHGLAAASKAEVVTPHPGGSVLYLERDTYARARIGDALEHAGFRLRYVVNDAQALRGLSDRPAPQAVVVDLASSSPDLSFLTAARRAAVTVATAASGSLSPEVLARAEALLGRAVINNSPTVVEQVVAAVSTGLTGAPSRLEVNPRAPFHALVEFKAPSAETWRAGVTFDVSRNGLFIRTLASEPARTHLHVRVLLPKGAVASCEGSVAWANPYTSRAVYSYPVGMGVHLTRMDAAYLDAIGPLTEPRPTTRGTPTRKSG